MDFVNSILSPIVHLLDRKVVQLLLALMMACTIYLVLPASLSHQTALMKELRSAAQFQHHHIKAALVHFRQYFPPMRKKFFSGFGNGSIPQIVHITHKSVHLPAQYESLLRHCVAINPGVTFLFWTDKEAEKFVKYQTVHSDNEVEKRLYKILTTYHGLEKADILRLMVVYFLGGVYMDLDTECKTNFATIHKELSHKMHKKYNGSAGSVGISCMLDQEQWVQTRVRWSREYCAMNNFFTCRPRHPFMEYIINNLKEDDHESGIMEKTGPFMLTKRYEEYNFQLRSRSVNDKMSQIVELAHPDWFSPVVDGIGMYIYECRTYKGSNAWFKQGCKADLPQYTKTLLWRKQKAFLIHWFMHLGYSFSSHRIKQTFSAHSLSGITVVELL